MALMRSRLTKSDAPLSVAVRFGMVLVLALALALSIAIPILIPIPQSHPHPHPHPHPQTYSVSTEYFRTLSSAKNTYYAHYTRRRSFLAAHNNDDDAVDVDVDVDVDAELMMMGHWSLCEILPVLQGLRSSELKPKQKPTK